MKPDCQSFRRLLEQKLVGRIDVEELTVLSWHEHLVGCGACRTLFESEEALEALLATLPEPKLPPHLRRIVLAALARSRAEDASLDRMLVHGGEIAVPSGLAADVLARLADEREHSRAAREARASERLDALLALDTSVVAPEGLSRRILARLEAERSNTAERFSTAERSNTAERSSTAQFVSSAAGGDARLDRLLDRDRIAEDSDLPLRVLAALERHRDRAPIARPRFALLRSAWVYGLAASLVATLVVWAIWPKRDAVHKPEMANGVAPIVKIRDEQVAQLPPDAQMLAAMDVLENWDLLMQDDVDVLISTSVDPVDEALLDYVEADGSTAPEKEPATPSKG
jgi:hypothetical protein